MAELKGAGGAPVSIAAVEKRFGSVAALQGVSLDAGAGEFLSLLGPSGSGKTTLLMMIAGFEIPDRGTIAIGGRDVTELPANQRNVGMVFQRYALFPHMTVAENIGFPLRMRGLARSEMSSRVEDALKLVRLDGYGTRLPSQLSGGQQQRVALARAVVFRPPVLLMDEPLAALDKKLRQAMQLEVRHLQRELGLTVLYVTHDQEEALTMSDRIAVLNDGRIEQIGRPEELYEMPASAFVADFIGETNFLSGDVVGLDARECRVLLDGDGLVTGRVAADGLAAGTGARLAVRPDRVRLGNAEGIEGTIAERIYSGAMLMLAVRIGETTTIMARGPSNGPDADRSVGDRVRVSWKPEDARVYPAAAER